MSSTLLRLGLWIVLIVVVLYVLQQTFEGGPVAEYVPTDMIQKALILGLLAVIAGVTMRMVEKGTKAVTKNRCVVCKAPVTQGAIYCRQHLRNVLHREEDRTHHTRTRQ